MKYKIILLFVVLLCTSCEKTVTSHEIVPLYENASLSENEKELNALFQFLGYSELSDSTMSLWETSDAVIQFAPDTYKIYPTLTDLEYTLGKILNNASEQGIELPERKYVAVVWGKLKSMAFVDDYMFIALNHYLGSEYLGYINWPDYLKPDKTPQRLPYDIVEAMIATKYPYDGTTALSRMLYEGALTLAKMQLVPDANLAEALGYSYEQLSWLEDNRKNLWYKIVGDKLLYNTSQMVAERLVSPAPSTNIIAANVPGRAGRYIGYRLVKDYLKDNDASLVEILSPTFYNDERILRHINMSD